MSNHPDGSFRIQLNPSRYTEHRNTLLRQHDGKACSLTQQLRGPLWVTNLEVPETTNTDYTHDGFLVVKVDQDGIFLGA